MEIKRIKVDGFKNLYNTNVEFGKISALVSVNNYGKSNYFKGIDFGVSFIKGNVDTKRIMVSSKKCMPFNKTCFGKNYYFEIECQVDSDKQKYIAIYSFETKWLYSKDDKGLITSEILKIKKDVEHQKFTTVIDRKDSTCLYKSSIMGRCNSNLKVNDLELAINKLSAYDNLYYIEIINELNNISFYMEDTLDPRSMYNPDPFILKKNNILFTTQNLPRVLYELKSNNIDKYELIENTFKSLFLNVEELKVEEIKINTFDAKLPDDSPLTISDSIYLLSFKDRNLVGPISFEEMSDGAKRILVLLTRIVIARMNKVSLIAVEEPENSIHPSLLNAYIQVISGLLDESKLIFTSHSPYLITYLENETIYAGICNKTGEAIFKKMNMKSIQKDANETETLVGDYLLSLICEESELLNDYVED